MFSVGRLCIKTAGREAGKHCVVVKKDKEEGFVFITGPKMATGVRRRRCNIDHLEPLEENIEIKADASDEDILKIYEKLKLFEKLGIEKKKPFVKPVKEEKQKKKVENKTEKKEEKKKETKSKSKKETKPKSKKETKKPSKK